MSEKMQTPSAGNRGAIPQLRLVRGALYGRGTVSTRAIAVPRDVDEDVWLDRAMSEIVAKMHSPKGELPDVIRDARRGKTHQWRALARFIGGAQDAEIDDALIARMILTFYRYQQKRAERRRLAAQREA